MTFLDWLDRLVIGGSGGSGGGGYPEPTGTKQITANGTHDVKDFASADVNVTFNPAGEEYDFFEVTAVKTPLSLVQDFVYDGGARVAVDTTTAGQISSGQKVCIKGEYAYAYNYNWAFGSMWVWGTVAGRIARTGYTELILNRSAFVIWPSHDLPTTSIHSEGSTRIFGLGGVNVDYPYFMITGATFDAAPTVGGTVSVTIPSGFGAPGTGDHVAIIGTYNGTTYAVHGTANGSNLTFTVTVDAVVASGGGSSPVPAAYGTPSEEGTKDADYPGYYVVGDTILDSPQYPTGTAPAVGTKLAFHADIEDDNNVKIADLWYWGTVEGYEDEGEEPDPDYDYAIIRVDGLDMHQTGTYPVKSITAKGTQNVTGYNRVNIDYSDVVPEGYKVAGSGRVTPDSALPHRIGETITVDCYEEEVGSRIAVGDLLATDMFIRSQSRPYVNYGKLWLWGTVTAVEDVAEYNYQRATIASVSGMAIRKLTEFPALTITANGTHDVTGMSQVTVNVPASSGPRAEENAIVAGTLSGNYVNNDVTSVGLRAFTAFSGLTGLSLASCVTVGEYACDNLGALKTLSLPVCKTIEQYAFRNSGVESVVLESCDWIQAYAFSGSQLTTLDLKNQVLNEYGRQGRILINAFDSSNLTTLIIRGQTNTWFAASSSILQGTPIASGNGYIYVPAALVSAYKTADGWSTYSAQFRALEDYTVDGTVTGDLDLTKI